MATRCFHSSIRRGFRVRLAVQEIHFQLSLLLYRLLQGQSDREHRTALRGILHAECHVHGR